jgi:hypothetical protein
MTVPNNIALGMRKWRSEWGNGYQKAQQCCQAIKLAHYEYLYVQREPKNPGLAEHFDWTFRIKLYYIL